MVKNLFTKHLSIVVIIGVILIIGIISTIVFSCSTKTTSITQDDFTSIAQECGLNPYSYKAGLTQYKDVTGAVAVSNNKYTIYYYECSSNSAAKHIFDSKKDEQAALVVNGNEKTDKIELPNFNSLKCTKGNIFWGLVRADNIVIFFNTKSEYKDEVNDILHKWGY